jgi:hypothetical protein
MVSGLEQQEQRPVVDERVHERRAVDPLGPVFEPHERVVDRRDGHGPSYNAQSPGAERSGVGGADETAGQRVEPRGSDTRARKRLDPTFGESGRTLPALPSARVPTLFRVGTPRRGTPGTGAGARAGGPLLLAVLFRMLREHPAFLDVVPPG